MAKHKHAALMLQYAKDWAETEEPWKRWEVTSHRNEWVALCGHPYWRAESEYRRKQKVILINGHEVPEPHRTPLKNGEVYWALSLFRGATSLHWKDEDFDNSYLENGFIHLTKEAAEKHFNALKSFTAKGEQ